MEYIINLSKAIYNVLKVYAIILPTAYEKNGYIELIYNGQIRDSNNRIENLPIFRFTNLNYK